MPTLFEIQHLLERLSAQDREAVISWLQSFRWAEEEGGEHGDQVAEPRAGYALTTTPFVTLEEYFEFEERNPMRHEYVNGAVYAMSGVSVAHARITRELLAAVGSHLRGKPCEAFAVDLKLLIQSEENDIVYYPDLMVACHREEWGKNFIKNPKFLVEILSPSTQQIDRREKALTYRRVPSVEEYVLVAQDDCCVTVQRRAERWRPQLYAGRDAIAQFHSIGLSVPLAQIYEGTL
jgi:Uma2 family endonuclease